ncbi:MAG TPA: ABC transporter permease [Acidimicrobiales bacterium]|nr:ABC transporter permease [Acidimicrobiales bacterium]
MKPERTSPPAPRIYWTLARRRRTATAVRVTFLAVMALLLFGPIVVLAVFSFNRSIVIGFPFRGGTLEWYRAALGETAAWDSLRASLQIALVVTPMCLLLGLLSAFALSRFRFRLRGVTGSFILLPLVIPWLLIGVSGLIFFSLVDVRLSLWTVGVMHVVIAFPLVTALLSAQLVRLDPHIHEASLDLGAGEIETLRHVIIPLLLPTIGASAVFVFSWSFNNFIVSFFTAGFDNTFPIWVFSSLRRARDLPVVNALATLISFVQIVVIVGVWQLLKVRLERRGQDIRDVVAGA